MIRIIPEKPKTADPINSDNVDLDTIKSKKNFYYLDKNKIEYILLKDKYNDATVCGKINEMEDPNIPFTPALFHRILFTYFGVHSLAEFYRKREGINYIFYDSEHRNPKERIRTVKKMKPIWDETVGLDKND